MARDYSGKTNVESLEQKVAGYQAYFGRKLMETWDALGNEIISGLYRVNGLRIRLIRLIRLDRVILDDQALGPAMAEHLAVIAALRTRDPRQSIAAIDAHLVHARNRALGV